MSNGNTKNWNVDDLVIANGDAERAFMLMCVVGKEEGKVLIRYIYPGLIWDKHRNVPFHEMPKGKQRFYGRIRKFRMEELHDPKKYNIELPESFEKYWEDGYEPPAEEPGMSEGANPVILALNEVAQGRLTSSAAVPIILRELNFSSLIVDPTLFEMLLNSIANLKHIDEMAPEIQADWMEIIDNSWDQGMKVLSDYQHGKAELPIPDEVRKEIAENDLTVTVENPRMLMAIRKAIKETDVNGGSYGAGVAFVILTRLAAHYERIAKPDNVEDWKPDLPPDLMSLVLHLRQHDTTALNRLGAFDKLRKELALAGVTECIDEILECIADLIEEGE